MNKKHENSACCRAIIIKYGKRRKQCTLCKRTWSVWKRKRGRKLKRIKIDFIKTFLRHDIASLSSLSKKQKCSKSTLQKRLGRSRELFIKNESWSSIPNGELILIADGVVELIEKKWRTVYLMLVRGMNTNEAIILPPFFRCGTETALGWKMAIDTIPKDILMRIRAIVCDGHVGLTTEAKWRAFFLQRCHFHLLARIQSRRSRWRIGRHKREAQLIFKHANIVLKCLDEKMVYDSVCVLDEIGWTSTSPEIRKTLSGFVKNYRDYRTYLKHPELNLPTTNNTAESLAGMIASLKHRLKGFPTLKSFTEWIIALLKFKKKIKCNGFYQQNFVA